MKKHLLLFAFVVLVVVSLGQSAEAQTTDPASWPVCRLGGAPIAPGPAPTEAVVWPSRGGPVIMTEAGPKGAVLMIRCLLPTGTEIYRGADGDLRDLPSNQPFWPVGWDAQPPERPKKGDTGLQGPPGPRGPRGENGLNGKDGNDGEDGRGFHCGTKCKILLGVGVAVGGYFIIDHNRDRHVLRGYTDPSKDVKCIATGVPTNCKP